MIRFPLQICISGLTAKKFNVTDIRTKQFTHPTMLFGSKHSLCYGILCADLQSCTFYEINILYFTRFSVRSSSSKLEAERVWRTRPSPVAGGQTPRFRPRIALGLEEAFSTPASCFLKNNQTKNRGEKTCLKGP